MFPSAPYDGPFAGLASALDQLADNFFLTDSEGRFVYVNPAFERITGYSRGELLGQTPRILKSGVHPRQVYEELWDRLGQGMPFRFIFTNRKKNGELYDEGVIISPLRDHTGAITHFASVGRVIDQFRQTYDVYTLLADASPIPMFVLQDEHFFYVNSHVTRVTGYAADQLIGKHWSALVYDEDREPAREAAAAVLAGTRPGPIEFRIVDKSGSVHWVMPNLRVAQFRGIAAVSGQFIAGSFIDITVRKNAEQRMKEALSMYVATIESTTDGIAITDLEGRIVGHNRRFQEMWELPVAGLEGLQAREAFNLLLRQIEDPDSFETEVLRTFEQHDAELATRLLLRNGRTFELYSRPQLIENSPAGRVWSFRDVTERERLETSLKHLASHDALTGIANRRSFQQELENELASASGPGKQGAILFVDVDYFKAVNDGFGHGSGDEFLRSVARCLSSVLEETDLLARLGGDEFGVLLRGADRERALATAERLLEAVAGMDVLLNGLAVSCTISIGCALFAGDGKSFDELLSHADTAMYRVKRAGGNDVCIYDAVSFAVTPLHAFAAWSGVEPLAAAREAFEVRTRPVVELETGGTRMQELYILPPSRAATGPVPASLTALRAVQRERDHCLVEAAFRLAGSSVNGASCTDLLVALSEAALEDEGLLELIGEQVKLYHLGASRVCFEISEAAAVANPQAAHRVAGTLRSYGLKVAIGGFGAGLSSLSQIGQLPTDFLRLDGCFLKDLPHSPRDQHIVRMISDLAAGFGMEVIAADVADYETSRVLKAIGVRFGQGPYFEADMMAGEERPRPSVAA